MVRQTSGPDSLRFARRPIASPKLLQFATALIAVIATISFLIVSAHAPIAVHADAGYDDALYMRLGRHLANGQWLGDYGKFTLMKGPGYPLFLAINAWLGLPIGLTQAIFHCGAIVFFFWIFARLSNMRTAAFFGFIITLWAPAPYFERIMRGAIYPGETLLFLGALIFTLYADLSKTARMGWAALTGLLCGWLVLTREEGIWIVPGLAFIVTCATFHAWRQRAITWRLAAPMFVTVIAFALTQNGFSHMNWIFYGKKIGVETNSAPFKSALAALQSVEVGERIPYVPVSHQARMAIYAVSPAFRTLQSYFDGPGGTPWQAGCGLYPKSCGDIGGGWFLWALRDAVESKGLYSSPAAAANFYRTLTHEIKQACKNGQLKCSTPFFALLPHITYSQWGHLPASLISGIRQISFVKQARFEPEPSSGSRFDMMTDLEFLGHPAKTPSPQDVDVYRITGWYHGPLHAWITGQLISGNDHALAVSITRLDSPNLAKALNDPEALHQQFNFEVACAAPCHFRFIDDEGAFISFDLAQPAGQLRNHLLGSGTLYIDSVTKLQSDNSASDIRVMVSTAARNLSPRLYTIFMPWLAGAAAVAILLVICIAIVIRRITPIDVLAAAIWVLLASRLILLGIVDISSFPGMNSEYLAPAYILLCVAIPVSFAALSTSIRSILNQRSQCAENINLAMSTQPIIE